jgi:hypothetical protein
MSIYIQLHLLGATCEIKMNIESDDEMKNKPLLEIIGRQGEKDLLICFDDLEQAKVHYYYKGLLLYTRHRDV